MQKSVIVSAIATPSLWASGTYATENLLQSRNIFRIGDRNVYDQNNRTGLTRFATPRLCIPVIVFLVKLLAEDDVVPRDRGDVRIHPSLVSEV